MLARALDLIGDSGNLNFFSCTSTRPYLDFEHQVWDTLSKSAKSLRHLETASTRGTLVRFSEKKSFSSSKMERRQSAIHNAKLLNLRHLALCLVPEIPRREPSAVTTGGLPELEPFLSSLPLLDHLALDFRPEMIFIVDISEVKLPSLTSFSLRGFAPSGVNGFIERHAHLEVLEIIDLQYRINFNGLTQKDPRLRALATKFLLPFMIQIPRSRILAKDALLHLRVKIGPLISFPNLALHGQHLRCLELEYLYGGETIFNCAQGLSEIFPELVELALTIPNFGGSGRPPSHFTIHSLVGL